MSSRLNSAADIKSLAAWLPTASKNAKGANLQVKNDNNAVYVAAGKDAQYSITPKTEVSGEYEAQAKENGEVVVKESGTYDSLEELLQVVTQPINASRSEQRKVLCAGRGLRNSIISATESNKKKSRPAARNLPLSASKRAQSLRADYNTIREPISTNGMSDELVTAITAACGECQPVSAILFNGTCPVTGVPVLKIGFYDDESDVWVTSTLSGEMTETFDSLPELQRAMESSPSEVEDEFDSYPQEEVTFDEI